MVGRHFFKDLSLASLRSVFLKPVISLFYQFPHTTAVSLFDSFPIDISAPSVLLRRFSLPLLILTFLQSLFLCLCLFYLWLEYIGLFGNWGILSKAMLLTWIVEFHLVYIIDSSASSSLSYVLQHMFFLLFHDSSGRKSIHVHKGRE